MGGGPFSRQKGFFGTDDNCGGFMAMLSKGDYDMKKFAIIAALPFALSVAACGDSVDGTDTTDLEANAVEPMDQGMSDPMETPAPMMTGTETGTMDDTMTPPPTDTATGEPMESDPMAE